MKLLFLLIFIFTILIGFFFNVFSQFFLTWIFDSILLIGLFNLFFSYIIVDKFFSLSSKFVVFKNELQQLLVKFKLFNNFISFKVKFLYLFGIILRVYLIEILFLGDIYKKMKNTNLHFYLLILLNIMVNFIKDQNNER